MSEYSAIIIFLFGMNAGALVCLLIQQWLFMRDKDEFDVSKLK